MVVVGDLTDGGSTSEYDTWKEIKDTKENILRWERQIKRYPENEVFPICLNSCKKILQSFEQIKSELEAWEVVKPSIHHIKEQRCFVIHNIYKNEHYDFIMKGLKKHYR